MSSSFKIGFLLYNHVTQLDLTGPAQFLARMSGAEILIVAKESGPVMTDAGFAVVPTHTFADCPELDMICVPGGGGQVAVMTDDATLGWLARHGQQAAFVTSVCSGSLLLGAAGLMKGYRAASHWAYRDMLTNFGAVPVSDRVVTDRNRITGGGVTAGIDFALTVIATIRSEAEAKAIQLAFEYAPQPPFDSGRPESAAAETIAQAKAIIEAGVVSARADA